MTALTADPYSPDPVFPTSLHCCSHQPPHPSSCPTCPPLLCWSLPPPPSWSSAPAPPLPRRRRRAGPRGGWQPSGARLNCGSLPCQAASRLLLLPSMSSAAVRKKQTERTEHRLTQRWRGAGQGSRLGLATPWPCLGTPPPQLELITPPRLVTNLVQPSHRDRLPAHEQHPRSGRFRVDCLTLLLRGAQSHSPNWPHSPLHPQQGSSPQCKRAKGWWVGGGWGWDKAGRRSIGRAQPDDRPDLDAFVRRLSSRCLVVESVGRLFSKQLINYLC